MADLTDPNQISREAWDANAEHWDSRMGDEGNDFFNVLCWPVLASLLDVQPGQHILDIACGNGLTSRRLAALGANVTAFDFSANLIEKANARSNNYQSLITYHVLDATDEQALLSSVQANSTLPFPTWHCLTCPKSNLSSVFFQSFSSQVGLLSFR